MNSQLKRQIRWLSLSLIVTLASLNLGQQTSAQPSQSTNGSRLSEKTRLLAQNPSADKLFRNVYEKRYTWDSQFPGYTAAVEIKQDNQTYKGRVRVNPDLSLQVTGIDNKNAHETIENQLGMINTHRQRVPFEVAHKNSTFTFGTKDKTGAIEIIEQGETNASYKLLNEQVTQVNRLIGPHAFTVETLDTQVTPEGYIATRYRATAFQPQTKQVLGEELSEDTYTKIGKYYLPARKVIQTTEGGKKYTVEYQLTDTQLLSAK